MISQLKTLKIASCLAGLLLLVGGCTGKEQVTFYHTYGYQKDNGTTWSVPLRARIYEPSRRAKAVSEAVGKIADSIGLKDESERKNLDFRLGELLADNEKGENLTIRFHEDTEDFPKADEKWETDKYGMLVSSLDLSDSKAKQLLQAQKSTNGWLSFRATSAEHSGEGRVRIIQSTGMSVISDIDDTIKITEVPAGRRTLFNNTFFRKFQAVPERATLCAGLEDASFHYVSGSPWQLNKPLVEFLFDEAKFPEGSIHMNDLIMDTRETLKAPTIEDLESLFEGGGIFEQKIRQISEIMTRFPARNFVLVGDSGECDPEVYDVIKHDPLLGKRVAEVRIRDLVGDWNKARLKEVTVIRAAIIPDAVSKAAKSGCGAPAKK